jgi:hypothetical protein
MRNEFNLSHEHKTSVDMGKLIPVMCEEVLPGDTFIHRATALARVAPLAQPLMHRVELRMHTFYVPNRILWPIRGGDPSGGNWEDFITGKDEEFDKPTVFNTGTPGNILDYMGVPPEAGVEVDALPVRAYNMIYNEFYRDQDLQAERSIGELSVANCAWQKDYFTVARPSPQQGDPQGIPVELGQLGVYAPDGAELPWNAETINASDPAGRIYPSGGTIADQLVARSGSVDGNELFMGIDDLRRSIALQRFAEARMRYGSRYVDYLRYIGVNPSDGRLDRPEYLGGGKEILSFSEVLSTAESQNTNVADMYGHGIGMGRQNGWRKMFEEHGWVITLLSARPKTVYNYALPRKFQRRTAMDHWQKELEVLPWQEVHQIEVDARGDAETVFGYVPRYEEYRHGVSHVSNTMRGGTENDWHMAREFEVPPDLNGSFIECDPTDRIYQDANMPDLIINVQHNLRARRYVGATAAMGVDL